MATVMNRHQHSHHVTTPRTVTQKVCIGAGIFFVLAGLGGVIMPGMLGMHLSLAHNIIHLASGALAIACGYADDPRKAYNFSIGFGTVYGLLGLGGFIFGEPGYPGVGHMEADENLLRVIPNVLEFGTSDHSVHILISAVLLVTAYVWKKRTDSAGRGVVNSQARVTGRTTSTTSDVFRTKNDSELRSDINRKSGYDSHSDIERRI